MQTGLRDLLGAEGKSIKWERPFLFFGALVAQDRIWLIVWPLFTSISARLFSTTTRVRSLRVLIRLSNFQD